MTRSQIMLLVFELVTAVPVLLLIWTDPVLRAARDIALEDKP